MRQNVFQVSECLAVKAVETYKSNVCDVMINVSEYLAVKAVETSFINLTRSLLPFQSA